MDDVRFREVVGMIVAYTLISQLTCRAEMSSDQLGLLCDCAYQGKKNPDDLRQTASKQEIN